MSRRRIEHFGIVLWVLCATVWPGWAWAQVPHYQASVYGISGAAKPLYPQVTLAPAAAEYGPAGGSNTVSSSSTGLPGGIASTGQVKDTFRAVGGVWTVNATMDNLIIAAPKASITAANVSAQLQSSCPSSKVTASGKTTVNDLFVNGSPVNATGAPNQVVLLPTGRLIINQTTIIHRSYGTYVLVTPLHLQLKDPKGQLGVDLSVLRSASLTLCSCPGTIYKGSAKAASLRRSSQRIDLLTTDTIFSPNTVNRQVSAPSIGDGSFLSALNASAAMLAFNNVTRSKASLDTLTLHVGIPVSVGKAVASARTTCSSAGPATIGTGSSSLSALKVSGVPVLVSGQPNQTMSIPSGKLVINEQILRRGNAAVTPLHVTIFKPASTEILDEVRVAPANAGIVCQCKF